MSRRHQGTNSSCCRVADQRGLKLSLNNTFQQFWEKRQVGHRPTALYLAGIKWKVKSAVFEKNMSSNHHNNNKSNAIHKRESSLVFIISIIQRAEGDCRMKSADMDLSSPNLSLRNTKYLLLQIALKCADICNPCRPWKISKRWSHLICEEFFQQGYLPRVTLCVCRLTNCQTYSFR